MTSVNADYRGMMDRWWQHTENKLDFYDRRLKEHQNYVYTMREWHRRKDIEQQQIYNYWQGKLEIHNNQKGQHMDIYA